MFKIHLPFSLVLEIYVCMHRKFIRSLMKKVLINIGLNNAMGIKY